MPRKKVQLAWIVNDAARRSTFAKRKLGLMKKLEELKVLCGVAGCAVLYEPSDRTPEAWPDVSEATRLLSQFTSLPEEDRAKNTQNQEDFLRNLVDKLKKRLSRRSKETEELEMMVLINEWLAKKYISDMSVDDLPRLAHMAGEKLREVRERIEFLQQSAAAAGIEKESRCFLEMMSPIYDDDDDDQPKLLACNGGSQQNLQDFSGPCMDGSLLQ